MARVIFAATLLLLAVGSAAQDRSSCPLPPSIQPVSHDLNMFSDEQESDLGDALAASLAGNATIIDDDELNDYLRQIGNRLLAQLPATRMRFEFFLLELPEVNAFSIPGGRIYVARKLIAFAKTEDEVAGVVAHEMGHILTHQGSIEYTRRLHKLGVTEIRDRADVFNRVHQVIENARRVHAKAQNEEQHQYVADKVALYAMARAGYAPGAYVELWDRFQQTHRKTGTWVSDLFGSTKPEEKRLREMLKSVSVLPPACAAARPAGIAHAFENWQADVLAYVVTGRRESLPGLLRKVSIDQPLRQDIWHARFSPNGEYILAQDDSGISVLTRDPLTPAFYIDAQGAHAAQFTPDSQSIVFDDPELRVEKWSIQDEERTSVHEVVVRSGCMQRQLSPDGNTMACLDPEFGLSILDVPSSTAFFEKPHFYTPTFEDYLRLLRQFGGQSGNESSDSRREFDFVNMGFSPDGNYFLCGRGATHLVFDIAARREAAVGNAVKQIAGTNFVFVGTDRVVARNPASPDKVQVVRFPSGERVGEARIGWSRMFPVTRGDYVLLRPVVKHPVGVYDLNKKDIVEAHKTSAADVYGGISVGERRNGELGLYEIAGTRPIAATVLPRSPLGPLRAAAMSSSGRWLALAGSTRGAIWDLARNVRVAHLRSFHGAWFGDDSAFYGDFPEFEEVERSIGRIDLGTGESSSEVLGNENVRQYGPILVRRTHLPKASVGVQRDEGDVTVEDVRSRAALWSRHFEHGVPELSVDARTAAVILVWTSGTGGAKQELQRHPNLHADKGDLVVEVLDGRTGIEKGAVVVTTGQSSFHVLQASADGDWLAAADSKNRVLLYSLTRPQETVRVFGSKPLVSAAAGLLAIDTEPGVLTTYDVNSGQKRSEYVFSSPVAFKQFSPEGKELFVVTKSQTVYYIDPKAVSAKNNGSRFANCARM